ncbi:MAG TPA: hypothetical protein VGM88_04220 [Kofleriaceae bacterium]|jgi:hypothetical protein
MSSLDFALQRALSVRLNLQISLSQLPIVEEWMDIHLDRWLEHNPVPPEMPDGKQVNYLAMYGSDLRRVWWGAWGDPRGFVPKMADYFKLCNIARSDAAVLDQIGEMLQPSEVGSWIGVWNGKVTTGWHFWDPHPWPEIEALFGTHEAKYQVKKWVDDHGVTDVLRFTQAIGDDPFSEVEFRIPGDTVDAQVAAASEAFAQLTGAPIDFALSDSLRAADAGIALSTRIRGGKITRVGVLVSGLGIDQVEAMCAAVKTPFDPRIKKMSGSLGQLVRVEYGRAGERAGVDVYLEPGDQQPGVPGAEPEPDAN